MTDPDLPTIPFSKRAAFKALTSHYTKHKDQPRALSHFTCAIDGLSLSITDKWADEDTRTELNRLAQECDIEAGRDAMFAGAKINNTENRAVLHTALRRPKTDSLMVDGEDAVAYVHDVLGRMEKFSTEIRNGTRTGTTGKAFRSVINIGIGGSDLGPAMVCDALKHHRKESLNVQFVSNVDGAHLSETLKQCKAETTLILVASKTFTTQETMRNAHTVRDWIASALGEDAIADHFAALSTNLEAVQDFGIQADVMFPFKDWVGGRYSLWSAIGLPIAIALGFEHFRALLDGAHAMDTHFQTTPIEKNMPIQLALHGVWNRNIRLCPAVAVLPYAQDLARFPAYLQQLDMESNGKTVLKDGTPITDYETGPIIFGEPGTNSQHSFFQLLHQGSALIPVELIGVINPHHSFKSHHDILLNNLLAQREAFSNGQADSNSFKQFDGGRPCVTLLLDQLDASHLGMLIALYEHKVYVQSLIWGMNAFDQFGVELGKQIAKKLENQDNTQTDPVTADLLSAIRDRTHTA